MSLYFALRDLTNSLPHLKGLGQEDFSERLLKMAMIGGSFPSSREVIEAARARAFSEKTTPEQICDVLACDPILALRLISLVNQTYYARGHSISSLLGAVNHLGLMKIGDIASDSAAVKSFKTLYNGRAVSVAALQELVLSSILSRRIARLVAPREGLDEFAHILSVLGKVGLMLLAYSRPSVYSSLYLDSLQDSSSSVEKNFRKVVGRSSAQLGAEIAKALNLPERIVSNASLVDVPPWNRRVWDGDKTRDVRMALGCAFVANRLATVINQFRGSDQLDRLIDEMAQRLQLEPDDMREMMGEVLVSFVENMEGLGLSPIRLPYYLASYTEPIVEADGTINTREVTWPTLAERVVFFVNELRACFKIERSDEQFYHFPQVVLCTLRGLVQGMNFDFAAFFRYERSDKSLSLAAWLGEGSYQVGAERREFSEATLKYMPDMQAVQQKKAVFHGDPIFENQWPFAAFPALSNGEPIGVFYAHKRAVPDPLPLDTQEQVAVIAIAEEWHEVPGSFS